MENRNIADIIPPSDNQWRINVFCPDCGDIVEAPVWGTDTEINTYYGPKRIKTKYKEMFVQCPFCGGYPHSPILESENKKNKLAAIEKAANA